MTSQQVVDGMDSVERSVHTETSARSEMTDASEQPVSVYHPRGSTVSSVQPSSIQPSSMFQSSADINVIVQQLLGKLLDTQLQNKELREKNEALEKQLAECSTSSSKVSQTQLTRTKSAPDSQTRKSSQPQVFIFPETNIECSHLNRTDMLTASEKTSYSLRSEADGAEEKNEFSSLKNVNPGVHEKNFLMTITELTKTKKELHRLQSQKVQVFL